MATLLGTVIADFTTSLATALAVGGTSVTLQSATDDDGVALPTGRYFLTIDGGNSSKEHISCTLTGTSLTSIKSVSRQGVETSGVARAHRIGATVVLTDFAHMKYMNDLLAGATTFNASVPLGYDGTASITTANQFATKAYVDGVAISGAPDASTSTKGIVKMSVAPASATAPTAVGDNDPRVPTSAQVGYIPTSGQKDALASTTTPASTNKYTTQKDFQIGAELYAADAGSNDTYAITLSPAPAAYVTGMVVRFKANTANTGACTLNVNSLGAKTIKKDYNSDLITGDILAGQFIELIYDGTNFQIVSQMSGIIGMAVASGTVSDNNAVTTSTGSGTNTDTTVTHGLGRTPKMVVIAAEIQGAGTTNSSYISGSATYDASGTLISSSWTGFNQSGSLTFAGWLRGTNSAMSVAGVGGFYDTITVSVNTIGATTFVFRINGKHNSSSGGTSTVRSITWYAI